MERAQIDPRLVVQLALQRNAGGDPGAQPPSGMAVPSAMDVALTARLREAPELFEVRLLEHFVVGEGAAVPVSEAVRCRRAEGPCQR